MYLSDISKMPEDTQAAILKDGPVDILVIDALHVKEKNASHLSMTESIVEARIFSAKKVYFVGMSHAVDYTKTNAWLAESRREDPTHPDCEMAYDTLLLDVTTEMLEFSAAPGPQ